MLTRKQNLIEVMTGGNPDRFVKQYEPFHIIVSNPLHDDDPEYGGAPLQSPWGYWQEWPEGTPGPFPILDDEHLVIKDIENWRDYVKAPSLEFSEAEWEPFIQEAESVDRNDQYVLPFIFPGVFERCHHLGELVNTLTWLYEYPDEMKELIKYITDWELELAEQLCDHLNPDGVFHHDDWGTQISTFMSVDMFEEFFLDSYKQIYGYYRSRGADMIVHHSDSFAATLVPSMIEMGIKVWQGVVTTNDTQALIKEFGPQITFMGCIDSNVIDCPDWNPEQIEQEVRRACTENGKLYFIPCATQGGPYSTFDGVYDCVNEMIDKMSAEMF